MFGICAADIEAAGTSWTTIARELNAWLATQKFGQSGLASSFDFFTLDNRYVGEQFVGARRLSRCSNNNRVER